MADTSTPAAPATADATLPAGSGAGSASSPDRPVLSTPEFLSGSQPFDIEDMLAGEASEQPPADGTQDQDPNDDSPQLEPADNADPQEGADPADPADGEGEGDEEPEVLEDATTGKQLVKRKDFQRMHRQRDEAKREAAEAKRELETLKAQLAQAEPAPVAETAHAGLFAKVQDEASLEALEAQAEAWHDWALANMNGGQPEGMERELTAEEVQQALQWSRAVIKNAPKHRDFMKQFTQTRSKVQTEHPSLFTPGTPEHKARVSWHRKLLNFANQPDQDAVIARLIKLERMEQEEAQGVASYPRVPKHKAAAGAADPARPVPKPLQVSTRPVSVKPAAGQPGGKRSMQEALTSTVPIDVEDLMDAG